jgi:SARP family transcriptional regulator, regulator of embCAB operon
MQVAHPHDLRGTNHHDDHPLVENPSRRVRPEGLFALREPPMRIRLLGCFSFSVDDAPRTLPPGSQRLLTILALRGGTIHRAQVAGALWRDVTDAHAYGSLRSELWRLRRIARGAIEAGLHELQLADRVSVDFQDASRLARRLLNSRSGSRESDITAASIRMLSGDLLPDWYDDWVVMEAEQWRQLRLHALEALSGRLREQGRYGEALDAALGAVAAEPLRESAHRAAILAHLSEGNQSEAIRAFERYRDLIGTELGLEPTDCLRQLLPGEDRVTPP